MNFDDIDFANLSSAERAEILQLWRDDRFAFYSRWRDPVEVQKRMIAWQRETLPGYTERPVDWVFEIIGELKASGAPQSVVDFHKALFAQDDKKNTCVPNHEVMSEVDKYFNYEHEETNWDADPVRYSEDDANFPYNQKYVDIIQGVYNSPTEHRNEMRRYREFGTLTEVVEERPKDLEGEIGIARPPFSTTSVEMESDSLSKPQLVIRHRFMNAYKMPE